MKNSQSGGKGKAPRIVTTVIVILILIFAALIAYTWLKPRLAAPAAVPAAQTAGTTPSGGQTGSARQDGGGAQSGGAPAGGRQEAAQGAGQQGGGNRQGGAPAGAAAKNATVVRATEVVLGTIENSVVINGDVLAASQVSIYPTVAGKLTEARFRLGDRVSRGQTVAMVDPSRPGEVFSQSPVLSTVGGTVLSAPLNSGDTVSTGTAIYVIGDLSSLMIETFVPERYSNAARQGLGALVSLEALPGETFLATVEEVSPVLDPASRTLRIRLRFNERDERIRAGMFSTVSLVTNTRRDIPVIPRSAIINTYGSWIVFIADDNNIARRKVITLGIENETSIEVLSGVEVGDRIVTAGQNFLSDGDLVRIVEL
ncbi:MAG: efflux RND transporter periplasmic adaptor subunit [Treponema sp.]|nr:efflux RND transporter periplasmic adaptor subunit [Treponema sp.]